MAGGSLYFVGIRCPLTDFDGRPDLIDNFPIFAQSGGIRSQSISEVQAELFMRREFLRILCCAALVFGFVDHGRALAQTSTAHTAQNPRATYQFFKKKELSKTKPYTKDDLSSGELLLGDCYGDIRKSLTDRLWDHARVVVGLQGKFALYPKDLWAKALSDFEETGVVRIIAGQKPPKPNDFVEGIAARFSAYQKTHKELPPASAGGPGCGDGEVAVEIVTVPKARRVQYINFYYYELCEEQSINPLDTSKCNRWTDLGSKKAFFAGRYKVLVSWPNGDQSEPRVLDVDSIVSKVDLMTLKDDTVLYTIKQ